VPVFGNRTGWWQSFANRLVWTFKWVSSYGSDFNYDFEVSFHPVDVGRATYNFAKLQEQASDLPGISVFAKDESGAVFRTYATYGRGIEMMNTAYHYLDLVPKGCDEAHLPRDEPFDLGKLTWPAH
jgi:predicted dithiol-disulfide oxidoreductase (DUF899 family)